MNEHLKSSLTALSSQFSRLYGKRLVQMILYGSHARGDADSSSDIDVLVVLSGPVRAGEEVARTSEIVAEISLAFNEVISCVFMDEARFSHRNGPLLRNIRREGVRL